jgi:hypothetical protein
MDDKDDDVKGLVLNGHTLTDEQHRALVVAIECMRDAPSVPGSVVLDSYRKKACELIALIHSPGKKKKHSEFFELCSLLGFFGLVAYIATLIANR